MTDYTTLKALAEDAIPWKNLNDVRQHEDEDEAGIYIVGHLSEDNEYYPVITVDCAQYYADSKPLADYIAVASPDVVLEMLDRIRRADELEAQQSETILHQAGEISRLLDENERLRTRVAELERGLKDAAQSLETVASLSGRKSYGMPPIETYMETFMEVRAYAAARAGVAREVIDAAMKEQA